MVGVDIAPVVTIDPEVVAAVQRLHRQVSSSVTVLSTEDIGAIVAGPATVLFLARERHEAGHIVGMLTLAMFRIPSGLRAWIEDVAVDEATRGRGIGEALSRAAVGYARGRGARTIELTSRPAREAANRLYRKLGFEIRNTFVYRLAL